MRSRRIGVAAAALAALLAGLVPASASAEGQWIPAPIKVNACLPDCLPLSFSMSRILDLMGDGDPLQCGELRYELLKANRRIAYVSPTSPQKCSEHPFGWFFYNTNGPLGPGQLWEAVGQASNVNGDQACYFDLPDFVEFGPGERGYAKVVKQIKRSGRCG